MVRGFSVIIFLNYCFGKNGTSSLFKGEKSQEMQESMNKKAN